MRSIDTRLAKLETASQQANGAACVLKFEGDTPDTAIARWMASNRGRGDPRDYGKLTFIEIKFV
jgi:hypothetical protein